MEGKEEEGQIAVSEKQVKEGLTEKERFGQTFEGRVRGSTQHTYKKRIPKTLFFKMNTDKK